MKKIHKITPFMAVLLVALSVYALSMLVLVAWGMQSSLKTITEFNRVDPLWLPDGAPWEWAWKNYGDVISNFRVPVKREVEGMRLPFNIGYMEMAANTLLYAGIGAVISAMVPCLVAYVTAKFGGTFSAVIHTIVVITMAIPIVGAQPSEIQFLRTFNLYDTIWGAWVLKFNFLGMYFLVYYGTFKGMAKDYAEAAYLDGASEFTVMARIMLPLVRNVIMTIFLIRFIEFWNDYQMPLLYMPSRPTLAYGAWWLGTANSSSAAESRDFFEVPYRMTACCIVAIPILILFIIFKEKIIGNVSMGGVKE